MCVFVRSLDMVCVIIERVNVYSFGSSLGIFFVVVHVSEPCAVQFVVSAVK